MPFTLRARPGQGAGKLLQLFALRRQQLGATDIETDCLHLFGIPAQQRTQGLEGRQDNLGQDVDDRLPDDAAVTEFRVVQATRDRQAEVDLALRVLQDGDGEVQWQILRRGALDALAQGQFVHDDLVVALQLALLDLVFQVQRQLAAFDLATGEGRRIRRQAGHLDIAEERPDIRERRGIEQVDLSHGARQAVFVHLALQFELRGGIAGGRGHAVDMAFKRVDAGTERQGQGKISEIHLAGGDLDRVDGQQEGRFRRPLGSPSAGLWRPRPAWLAA